MTTTAEPCATSGAPKNAVWYFDVISPFAYLAAHRIDILGPDIEIKPQPVLFAGLLGATGNLGPAEIPAKRIHTYRLCHWRAHDLGLPFRMPPSHPFLPLAPLRLLCALGSPWPAVLTTLDFIWGEGHDPSDPKSWSTLCERLGVEDGDGLIAERDARTQLRTATETAVAQGVFGVPTLAVNGELFWGEDALGMAGDFIGNPALFETGEMARMDSIIMGVERRRPRLMQPK